MMNEVTCILQFDALNQTGKSVFTHKYKLFPGMV